MCHTSSTRKHLQYKQDTLNQLQSLIKTVTQGNCLVIYGDFDRQLKRNIPVLTGKCVMIKKHEKQGHDQELLDRNYHTHKHINTTTHDRPITNTPPPTTLTTYNILIITNYNVLPKKH